MIGLGILVTAFTLKMNPKYYYRRKLSFVIPAGFLINALGYTFTAFASSSSAIGGFHWDGTVSGWFYIAWAAIVGFLVWADTKQN